MSAPQFTPAPWRFRIGLDGWPEVVGLRGRKVATPNTNQDGCLIAAAPELYDGCNAILGLVQLLLGRDDLSNELRLVLTSNHRITEAEAAVRKAAEHSDDGCSFCGRDRGESHTETCPARETDGEYVEARGEQ